MIKSIAVYHGSSDGRGGKYLRFAYDFGAALAARDIKVIYGGADVGTMKALADGVSAAGGYLTGVFPDGFGGKREVAAMNVEILRPGMTEEIIVKDFAERKAVMESLSDCAVVLPGGLGSMDELFCYSVNYEIGLHDKTVYVLNIDGYYEGLKAQIATFKREGFLGTEDRSIVFCDSAEELFALIFK